MKGKTFKVGSMSFERNCCNCVYRSDGAFGRYTCTRTGKKIRLSGFCESHTLVTELQNKTLSK